MSYQVLARKWRPRSFHELVGQQHVLRALVNALDNDRLHHAYLFTGTRGVGKTTIARILAKCLNCESGVSSEPCGQCGACVEIDEGRFIDLIEVDAASRTKVEDTRELLENVQYAPTRGRFKVYLIDEVHMLSAHSFNALLKTLEEPPPHIKFLLATTDPQKLPVTILSRCLQFHLKNMDPQRIVDHLQKVLEAENVPCEEAALWQLGRAADGSMRDAMSLADQAIAFGGGKLAEAEVRAMLGTIDQQLVFRVLQALVTGDGRSVLDAVAELAEHAPDYAAALADLLSTLHRIAIAQALPEALDNSAGDRQQVLELATQLPAEDVQLFYQTALLGQRDLPLCPDARGGFEMILLRMLAFRPQGVHSVPTQPLGRAEEEQEPAPAKKPEAAVAPAPQGPAAAIASQLNAAAVNSTPPPEEKPRESIAPDLGPLAAGPVDPALQNGGGGTGLDTRRMRELGLKPARQVRAPEKIPATTPQQGDTGRLSLQTLRCEDWIELYTQLKPGGVLQSTASNCQLRAINGHRLEFLMDRQNSSLLDDSHAGRMAELISKYFGESVEVQIEVGEVSAETPAARVIRLRQERHRAALESLNEDPMLQQLMQQFDATLVEDSVKCNSDS